MKGLSSYSKSIISGKKLNDKNVFSQIYNIDKTLQENKNFMEMNEKEYELRLSNDFKQENKNEQADFPLNLEKNKRSQEIKFELSPTENNEEIESISSKYKNTYHSNYENKNKNLIEAKIYYENSSLKEFECDKFNSSINEIRNTKMPDHLNQLNNTDFANKNFSIKFDKNDRNIPLQYEKKRIREKTSSYMENNFQECGIKMNEKKVDINGIENKIENLSLKTKKKNEITLMNTNFLDSDQNQDQLKIKDYKKNFFNHFDDEDKENNNKTSNFVFKANIPSIKFERVSLLSDSSEDVI